MRFRPDSGRRSRLFCERGATVIEYAVLIALVAVLVVLAVPSVGNRVSERVLELAMKF
jgi:Flp pilus assembly pilin Flp